MTTHDTTPDAEEGEEGNALLGLQTLTTKIRSEIADALKAGDDPRLFKASEQLRNVNALKEKHKAVWLETQALLNAGLGNEQPNHVQPTSVHSSPASSRPPESQSVQHKKANGKRLRDEWINQHGQALNHFGRTLYRTPSGDVLGIACATEKKGADASSSRWWLGLPSGKFHSAALLCEGSTGGCFAVCLSKDFVSKHRSWFSKSSGGQEQFTVLKLGGKVYIQVPSKGRLDVSEYVDKYGLVI